MRSELRRGVFSVGTMLACCIVLVCFLGFSIPVWLSTDGSALDYRASALELSLGGDLLRRHYADVALLRCDSRGNQPGG